MSDQGHWGSVELKNGSTALKKVSPGFTEAQKGLSGSPKIDGGSLSTHWDSKGLTRVHWGSVELKMDHRKIVGAN